MPLVDIFFLALPPLPLCNHVVLVPRPKLGWECLESRKQIWPTIGVKKRRANGQLSADVRAGKKTL